MIKEAYVSFEVAKLLKEKGFTEECEYFYDWYKESESYHICSNGGTCNNEKYPDEYSMPTHQMAMTWLREVYHLFININIEVGDIQMLPSYDFEESVLGYSFAIYNEETLVWMFKDKTPRSYEDAVEAALKYCLENLI